MSLMFLTSLLILSIFFFQNTMYYTLSLLFVTCISVFTLVVHNSVQPLTGVMLLLVYLGAIMILIGYICAVSPNFITISSFNSFYTFTGIALVLSSLISPVPFPLSSTVSSPSCYFLTPWGMWTFALISVMLFITLLMVTSQFFSPNGPFRSV